MSQKLKEFILGRKPEDLIPRIIALALLAILFLSLASLAFDPSLLGKATDIFGRIMDITKGTILVLVFALILYLGYYTLEKTPKKKGRSQKVSTRRNFHMRFPKRTEDLKESENEKE